MMYYKLIMAWLCWILFNTSAAGQTIHSFEFSGQQFLLDGRDYQIISGEMHPSRIPKPYWKHRIQMARAMGCNTIALYVFWNYHEITPGQFDFVSGNKDLQTFIDLCRNEGLWVILRPGPYACGEWDLGGIPPYLLKVPDIKLRCMDTRYMQAVNQYIDALSPIVKPNMIQQGGNVLMVQIENEYGSYGNDREYLKALQQRWVANGIEGLFYTSDGPTDFMLEAGTVEGGAIGLDSGNSPAAFETAHRHNPRVPVFSGETYPGWLTHWGESWASPDTNALHKEVEFLLKEKKSFNLYVIHGGTNFGFTAGANAFSPTQYQPDVTSYDYDAPIDEQGNPTKKYYMLRNLMQQYRDEPLPEIPASIPAIAIAEIQLEAVADIWNNLPQPVQSPQPVPMEALDQNQGLMLYRTRLIGHKSGTLTIHEPHDLALVFLNGVFIDTVYRDGGKWSVQLPKTDIENPLLEILVEGMGHINFAQYMIDRKGITDRVTLNGMTLMNWDLFPMSMSEKQVAEIVKKPALKSATKEGVFFKGEFMLEKTGDTFFDLTKWQKGIVYVNGHNLGRYWNIGPQFRLYCPAEFLKPGKNEIVVFDLFQKTGAGIVGATSLK